MPFFSSSQSLGSTCLTMALVGGLWGCSGDPVQPAGPDGGRDPVVDGGFFCWDRSSEACLVGSHFSCAPDGEFLRPVEEDCAARGLVCVPDLWCVVCHPGEIGCVDGDAARCNDDGLGWTVIDVCDIARGFACRSGACDNLCDRALRDRSYVGCEFYSVDLDNASIAPGRDASAQQYAVVVSNPGTVNTEVVVEINEAPYGAPLDLVEIERMIVLPGDLEVLRLPRREVDGASSNASCDATARICSAGEVCVCSSMDTIPPCLCRVSQTANGMNDGTHTAITSRAFRIRSVLPIIAYQFNPLDNVGVFSNDASLLLPTSAIDVRYSVIGWPQTIANDNLNPARDFDPSRMDEDLRATLTIVGTAPSTMVTIDLGELVFKVLGVSPFFGDLGPGGSISLNIGPFDVINLETQGLNADFTGTVVTATEAVSVFSGSEASDAPRFESYTTRQCCADHLEEQLFPDTTLGRRFIIGRMPPRSVALNAAFLDPTRDSVPEANEPEWVRVLAVSTGFTIVTTTLPAPDDRVMLDRGQSIIFRANQNFILQADKPVAVLQVLSSQAAVGIGPEYPGGDPAIIAVPPVEQYRRRYVFLTPDLYAFDFVTITASRTATVFLDDARLDPLACTTTPADGIMRLPGDPPPDEVVYQCQLSFPDVIGLPNVRVEPGLQDDGVHTVAADQPIGIVVYGFDAFVSYAYAGGLNLELIN